MAEYLTAFDNHAQYEAFTGSTSYLRPNVSICKEEEEVHYGPFVFPLTFEAIDDCTFQLTRSGASYSVDNGLTWTELPSRTPTPTVSAGNKIMWKGEITPQGQGIGQFSSTGRFNAFGNPMSMLFGDDFGDKTSLSGKGQAFATLFSGCTGLISAENLKIDHITGLTNACYNKMFYQCTSLIKMPNLYWDHTDSYESTFNGCTSLVNMRKTVANASGVTLYQTFQGCTSLVDASNLEIHAETINGYAAFVGCRSLEISPILDGTFTHADAPTSIGAPGGGHNFFYSCPSLKQITYLGSNLGVRYYTKSGTNYKDNYSDGWVYGVQTTSGTFIKKAGVTYEYCSSCDANCIPCNWTIVEQ